MAKQIGIIPLSGAIDTITFTDTQKDGRRAGKKSKLNKDRIANSPAFLFTRQNNAEFGRAAAASTQIITACNDLLYKVADGRMFTRLVRTMREVIRKDSVNERGERRVLSGNLAPLAGFEFNEASFLKTRLKFKPEASIERMTGLVKFSKPAFIPTNAFKAPESTTHFKLILAALAVDFQNDSCTVDKQQTALLPWNNEDADAIDLTCHLPVASPLPLLAIIGIQFFQYVNGKYTLTPGGAHALKLVTVDEI